ncbi:MAG: TonB family protein [Elusimicrobia bacterium]|nr:TonB family protein [Elusimicrobiota bacterium]
MNRLPATVTVSLALHAGALAAAAFLLRAGPRETARVVEGVDLIVSSPRPNPEAAAPAVKPPPLSTFDFLKLALPTIPRAAPVDLEEAHAVHHAAPVAEPKLQDAAHRDAMPKLAALDLSRRPAAEAPLDARVETRRRAAATLAALPALEDVGRRRVRNLPQALALDERRREATTLAGVPALDAPAPTRRQALAAAAALRDAAPAEEAPHRGLDSILPERPLLDARPKTAAAPRPAALEEEAPAPVRRAPAAAAAAKKGVEIEGPLKNRRVAAYSVPAFPGWAQKRGILEADVSIRFTVDEAGDVQPGMRVTSSSGYGRIDRLALDALKTWRFAAAPGAGTQWGVITFRFVLE